MYLFRAHCGVHTTFTADKLPTSDPTTSHLTNSTADKLPTSDPTTSHPTNSTTGKLPTSDPTTSHPTTSTADKLPTSDPNHHSDSSSLCSEGSSTSSKMSSHKYNLRHTPQKNTPTKNTPQKLMSGAKGEPVFKTPMTFSPRVSGDMARPSPSRHDIWKAQLGFDDSELSTGEDTESDMEEGEDKENLPCSAIEYQALLKELQERNAQRADLVLQLKAQLEKNKQYKQGMEKSELTKKQQIKILRKTHETSLQEKENLIRNLESIIEEHEGKIAELQETLKDGQSRSNSEPLGLHRLVKQITDLQEKHTELTQRALTAENQLEQLQADMAKLAEEMGQVDRDRNELQEEVIKLRSSKGNGSTDDQKLVHKLERENDELRASMRELSAQKREETSPRDVVDGEVVNKLKEEKDQQVARIAALEADLSEQQRRADDSIQSGKVELQALRAENQRLSQEVRSLQSQLVGLQAKSPEVVTKIKTVEVESQSQQQECERLREEIRTEQEKYTALNNSYTQLQTESKTVSKQLTQVQADHSAVVGQLQQLQTGQKSMGDNISELHQKNQDLSAEIHKVKSENEALASRIAEQQEEREKLTSEVGQLMSDNGRLETRLEQTMQVAEQRESELAEARAQVSQKDADLEVMLRETGVLQGQLEARQGELVDATTQLASSEERGQQLQRQLEQYGEEVQSLQQQMETELNDLRQQQQQTIATLRTEHETRMRDVTHRLEAVTCSLQVLAPAMMEVRREYEDLKKVCRAFPNLVAAETQQAIKQVCTGIAEISQHNQELVAKYRREMALRKKFHNELVELKGNIRVYCRVRPKIKEDGGGAPSRSVVSYDADDDALINVLHKQRVQQFELDRVFNAEYSQQQVYNEVTSLVTSCVDGYNVCIFAYGQTGSGKTYTMEGTAAEPGMNQRALMQLFSETSERSHATCYTIHVSVLEIYNEMIRDLLGGDPTCKLEVKMNPEGGVHVPGLTYREVTSVEDVNGVFKLGHKNRVTACTNMNEHSSRSHALLRVRVMGKNVTSGAKTTGVLNLVDLAGSERVSKSGADGARLKEAQNINKSLSSLGDVIQALRTKQSYVPYRNSKLTYLLQDSLGGDSKTLMITQVSPVERNVGETLASLNFAQRVRTVELGQASKKSESAEIAELKEKLAQYEDVAQFNTNFKGSTSKLSPPNKIQRQK